MNYRVNTAMILLNQGENKEATMPAPPPTPRRRRGEGIRSHTLLQIGDHNDPEEHTDPPPPLITAARERLIQKERQALCRNL